MVRSAGAVARFIYMNGGLLISMENKSTGWRKDRAAAMVLPSVLTLPPTSPTFGVGASRRSARSLQRWCSVGSADTSRSL